MPCYLHLCNCSNPDGLINLASSPASPDRKDITEYICNNTFIEIINTVTCLFIIKFNMSTSEPLDK